MLSGTGSVAATCRCRLRVCGLDLGDRGLGPALEGHGLGSCGLCLDTCGLLNIKAFFQSPCNDFARYTGVAHFATTSGSLQRAVDLGLVRPTTVATLSH